MKSRNMRSAHVLDIIQLRGIGRHHHCTPSTAAAIVVTVYETDPITRRARSTLPHRPSVHGISTAILHQILTIPALLHELSDDFLAVRLTLPLAHWKHCRRHFSTRAGSSRLPKTIKSTMITNNSTTETKAQLGHFPPPFASAPCQPTPIELQRSTTAVPSRH